MNKVLKVQEIPDTMHSFQGEKPCFLTYHLESDESKAKMLDTIIDNPSRKFRIVHTEEEYKKGDWYEELCTS